MPTGTRVLLVGAGHAHLEVLRRFALERPADLVPTVVSLEERHFYSGMTPGYLAGRYRIRDLTTSVPDIARRAGAACVVGRAVRLDPGGRTVALEDGRSLPYDLVSLNIGSLTAGQDAGSAREAEAVKPLHRVVRLRRRLEALTRAPAGAPARVVVVGAGAGGVEVAFAAAAALDAARRPREITIVERAQRLLDGYGARFRRLAARALDARGIRRRLGTGVRAVEPHAVHLEDGSALASDLTVWLTGAAGAPLLAASGLPADSRGFLWTEATLRSVADARVFAVGDCGTIARHPTLAKSGVYAVRQAPVLWRNLLAAARDRPLTAYRPQRQFLSILNTADGRALLWYKGFASHSRWAWWLKDRIDRRFVRRYQVLEKREK